MVTHCLMVFNRLEGKKALKSFFLQKKIWQSMFFFVGNFYQSNSGLSMSSIHQTRFKIDKKKLSI